MKKSMLLFCVVMFTGCAKTLSATDVSVIMKESDGFWMARRMKSKDFHETQSEDYSVIFFCKKTDKFPQCHAAQYIHPDKNDVYWPAGVPCPPPSKECKR